MSPLIIYNLFIIIIAVFIYCSVNIFLNLITLLSVTVINN